MKEKINILLVTNDIGLYNVVIVRDAELGEPSILAANVASPSVAMGIIIKAYELLAENYDVGVIFSDDIVSSVDGLDELFGDSFGYYQQFMGVIE